MWQVPSLDFQSLFSRTIRQHSHQPGQSSAQGKMRYENSLLLFFTRRKREQWAFQFSITRGFSPFICSLVVNGRRAGKETFSPLFSSENHRVIISLFGSKRSKKPLKGAFTKRAFCAKFNGRMLLEKKTRSTLGSGDASFDQKVNNSRGLQKWRAAVTLYFPVTPFFST